MLESIGTGVTHVISWLGSVVSAFFTEAGQGTAAGAFHDLLPIIGVAVGIGIVGFGIRTIKNVVWGY